MKTFRTLELAIQFHHELSSLKLKGHLKDQLFRAAASIALNLAEGNAKSTIRDKRNFFHMAFGSLRECQTILKLLRIENVKPCKTADELGAHLYKLVNSRIKDSPARRLHSDI
jgi:four helix bundle protein